MLYYYIIKNIQSNTILPNEKLPSLREMAEIFCVSIGTVQAAYDSLERENFIYSIPKKGYFVLGTNGHPKVKQQLIDFFPVHLMVGTSLIRIFSNALIKL